MPPRSADAAIFTLCFPLGGSCRRSRLMRGRYGTVRRSTHPQNPPLIRHLPRGRSANATFPPRGEGQIVDKVQGTLSTRGERCASAPCGRGHTRSASGIFAENAVSGKNDLILFAPAGANSARLFSFVYSLTFPQGGKGQTAPREARGGGAMWASRPTGRWKPLRGRKSAVPTSTATAHGRMISAPTESFFRHRA